MADVALAPSAAPPPPRILGWFMIGWLGLTTAYLMVFSLTGFSAAEAAGFAVANVVPVAVLGHALDAGLKRRVIGRSIPVQIAAHALLIPVFVVGWYLALIPTIGVAGWIIGGELHLNPLTGPALPWQLFQGLMTYGLLAALAYATAPRAPSAAPLSARPLERYLMRRGEDIRPVDVDAIVSIRGADDYAEVSTGEGVHLARMTLQEFEARLDPERFIRVHRSRIINFHRMTKAEPAGGGRLLVHMETGEVIPISRAGAQRLRDRLV